MTVASAAPAPAPVRGHATRRRPLAASVPTPAPAPVRPIFEVSVAAWPPSKSNRLKRVSIPQGHGLPPRPGLAVTEAVKSFEATLAAAIEAEMHMRGHFVHWYLPHGRKTPVASNPYYPAEVEVDVAVYLAEPLRTNRDTDGIWKVTLDAGKLVGLWVDDRQVGDTHTYRRELVGLVPADQTRIVITPVSPPSWANNPGGKIATTAALAAAKRASLRAELQMRERRR